MSFVSRLAVAAALGLALPVAVASTPAVAQALSPAVGKALNAAQAAAKAGNTAAAINSVKAARAAAQTGAERAKVAQMAAYVYTRAGQYTQAARELESVGAGPRQLAPLYYQAGNYARAIELAKRAGGNDMQTIVAQSYLKQGKFAEAAGIYQQMLKANPNDRRALENLAAAQYKSGDKKAYLATTERLIRIDPSPTRWKTLLLDLKQANMPREAKLALYQLMRETGAITRADDYAEFAKLAIVANQPGVAKSALDEARAANAITPDDPMTSGLFNAASQRAAQAQAGLARLPRTPVGQFQAGNIHLGAGQWPQAAAAYGAAVKGNVPNVDQARVFQGISLVRAGQAAAAKAALDAVPATSPYKDIAALWALYASTKA